MQLCETKTVGLHTGRLRGGGATKTNTETETKAQINRTSCDVRRRRDLVDLEHVADMIDSVNPRY